MDVIVEDALNSLRRPMKSIDHNRKSLLELRADMRNVQGILQSLNQDEALQKSKVIGDLYNDSTEDSKEDSTGVCFTAAYIPAKT